MVRVNRWRKRRRLASVGLLLVMAVLGCSDEDRSTSTDDDHTPPGLKTTDFTAATECQECHPVHYREWSGSMHAYALRDPVFAEVRRIGESMYINALDQACVQCHSVVGSRTGEIPWGPYVYEELAPPAREGVACDMCHVISGISRLSNAGVLISPGHTKFGTIRNPEPNDAHASEYNPLYASSEYCGACHDFVTDRGLELETTFREWRESGFYVTGKTCSDCHMPAYQGSAVQDGPIRTLHRHTFAGADLALVPFPERPDQLQAVTSLLRDAVTLELVTPTSAGRGGQTAFEVRITNDGTGHDVPSGVPFNRQVWLSVTVRDGQDDVVYSSGQLDENDDLMDGHSSFPERDPDLFNVQATMLRADSVPTGFTWDAVYLTNPSIKAGETRVAEYEFAVPADVSGNLTVDVALRFRSFPPYVIRGLGLDSLLPIPIINMAEATRLIAVE